MMNTMDALDNIHHIHMVGIGGIGVSALVPVLADRGFVITGSDKIKNEVTERLEAQGIKIEYEHRAKNIEDTSLLVVSSAIPRNNVELEAARSRGIPIWSRAQMLGHLLSHYRPIVVTGMHGKTTVTAMITHMLRDNDFDPTAFIGGDCASLGGNAVVGKGEWAVAEGDESDGSFLHLKPEISIVNNLDSDHLDYYKEFDSIVERFQAFLDGGKAEGWIVYSVDCEHTQKLTIPEQRQSMTYGFSEQADVRAFEYAHHDSGCGCSVSIKDRPAGRLHLNVNGRINCHNALAAVCAGEIIGIPFEKMAESLRTFQSVKRRMEYKGATGGVTVIDDYAHHPNEIRATIEALRERRPLRIIGIFQPHLYSRTLHLHEEFSDSFAGLDLLILTDIYGARENPIPKVSGELLVHAVRKKQVPAVYIPHLGEIPDFLNDITRVGDVLVTIGAGDIWKVGTQFLDQHGRKEEERNG